MNKLLKLCFWLSIPVFLAVLMYVYAMLPEREILVGHSVIPLTKEGVFYVVLIIFVLCNALIFIYQKMRLPGVDLASLELVEMTRPEKDVMWVNGLVMFLNITFAFLLFYLGLYHSRDIEIGQYVFLLYMGPILISIWIFYWIYLRLAK